MVIFSPVSGLRRRIIECSAHIAMLPSSNPHIAYAISVAIGSAEVVVFMRN